MKLVIEIVKQFQNYSFTHSERNNLYQLVFYRFASQFSKVDNAQFITPLQIIDFIVDIVKAIQSTYHDFYALGNGSNWGVYI